MGERQCSTQMRKVKKQRPISERHYIDVENDVDLFFYKCTSCGRNVIDVMCGHNIGVTEGHARECRLKGALDCKRCLRASNQ